MHLHFTTCSAVLPGELKIEQRFRVGRELNPIFEAVGMDPSRLFAAEEVRECATEYVKRKDLEKSSTYVNLEPVLADALFKVRIVDFIRFSRDFQGYLSCQRRDRGLVPLRDNMMNHLEHRWTA